MKQNYFKLAAIGVERSAWAPMIAHMPDERRIATLVAFAYTFEITALDDALHVLDMLITTTVTQAY